MQYGYCYSIFFPSAKRLMPNQKLYFSARFSTNKSVFKVIFLKLGAATLERSAIGWKLYLTR